MSWITDRDYYQSIAKSIEPSAIVISKDHWVWTFLWVLAGLGLGSLVIFLPLKSWWRLFWILGPVLGVLGLYIVTRIILWNLRAATIGPVQGHPEKYVDGTPVMGLNCGTVVHEGNHSKWYQILGWLFFPIAWINRSFRAWLGCIPFWLIYFILPFPVYLCYGRYRLELNADREKWRLLKVSGAPPEQIMQEAMIFAACVAGRQYFYPWPRFWVMWGFKRAAKRVIDGK